MIKNNFTFIDLFAGVGGFHIALSELGGTCVFASEIDDVTRAAYVRYHGAADYAHGDIKPLTRPNVNTKLIPKHDVLAAGFPCQPFSKSGSQLGVLDTRGTLFDNILAILENPKSRPKFVLLENVKNLLGPKHHDSTWLTIKERLRSLGYWVAEEPTVYSPHLLSPENGGAPQNRERVYIVAVYVGQRKSLLSASDKFKIPLMPSEGWNPDQWNLYESIIDAEKSSEHHELSDIRLRAFKAWQAFVIKVGKKHINERTLPGFPLWEFAMSDELIESKDLPDWKVSFLRKNRDFYLENRSAIDAWRDEFQYLPDLPLSYRKFEWQAGSIKELDETVIQFRPSGLRVRPATYLPALVAINQQSYLPKLKRYVTVNEAAAMQGLPTEIFSEQPEGVSFKQLGNSVSVPVVKYVFSSYLEHFASLDLIS